MVKTLSPPVRQVVEQTMRFCPQPDGTKRRVEPGVAIATAAAIMELTLDQLHEIETALRVASLELDAEAHAAGEMARTLGLELGTPELQRYLDSKAPNQLIDEMAAAILILTARDRRTFLNRLTQQVADPIESTEENPSE